MRRTRIAAWALAALVAGASASAQDPAASAWSRAPGGLLPLQDQVGNPLLAAMVEDTLRQELAGAHTLVDPARLRDAQRRLRLRDTSRATPAALARLGDLTGAEWLFSATLHQAAVGRVSRATQAFAGSQAPGPVPQIILSARAIRLRSGAPVLGWAGFEAASGLDHRRLLGLGEIADPELLARNVTRRLVEAFEQDVASAGRGDRPAKPGARPARGGFLRRPIAAGAMVAVVPFLSVAERNATVGGDTVTDLALAVLHQRGAEVMLPGLVNEILRQRGSLRRGEVDAEARADLRRHGADLIMTGAVETWELHGRGTEPEPWVGFSARLLDAETGAILWWNGQDRRGWDAARTFGLGRVHSSGVLAQEVMESLVASFKEPRR